MKNVFFMLFPCLVGIHGCGISKESEEDDDTEEVWGNAGGAVGNGSTYNGEGCSPGSDATDTGVSPEFAPTEGFWSWHRTTYSNDKCNFQEDFPAETIDAVLWDLVLTDDGFQLDNEIWTDDPIQCVVAGMDFTCSIITETIAEQWPEESENEGVPDATYTTIAIVTGGFTDGGNGSVAMTIDLACEGMDCDAHGEANGRTAPCNTAMSGDFVHSQ